MSVLDTKLNKTCSRCGIEKNVELFILRRNICRECVNKRCREKYYEQNNGNNLEKECNVCSIIKNISLFIKNRNICKDCNNNKRVKKYENNSEHREKIILQSSIFKKKKTMERQEIRNIKQMEIGIDNKKCKYCLAIKHKTKFRHNRLKCKDCERDEPISKLIRNVRGRILSAINRKNKHTIIYLGCNCSEYLKYMTTYDSDFNYENHGNLWHIDHVIPISKFNIMDENEQLIAFNWRNTMPLLASENLSKNNKIIIPQIKNHYKKLIEYHNKNNIDFPQEFIELFARYLDAGSSLEPLLPPTIGNVSRELG